MSSDIDMFDFPLNGYVTFIKSQVSLKHWINDVLHSPTGTSSEDGYESLFRHDSNHNGRSRSRHRYDLDNTSDDSSSSRSRSRNKTATEAKKAAKKARKKAAKKAMKRAIKKAAKKVAKKAAKKAAKKQKKKKSSKEVKLISVFIAVCIYDFALILWSQFLFLIHIKY